MITKNDEYRKLINRIKYKIRKELDNNFESNLMIIVDTKEQENKHIIRDIQKENIFYSEINLKFGDYSFYYDGVDYTDEFSIERKNGVDELISSLIEGRFEREIKRAVRTDDNYFEILVENGSMIDILEGNFRNNAHITSEQRKKSISVEQIVPMIHSRQIEYNIPITFINRYNMFNYILGKIKYYLRYRMLKDELKINHNIEYNNSIYY